jgi:hypothetical protein
MLSRTYLLTTFVDAEETWMGAVQVRCSATDRMLHLVRCAFLAAAAAGAAACAHRRVVPPCAHRRVVPPCLMPHCASVVRNNAKQCETMQHARTSAQVGRSSAGVGSVPAADVASAWAYVARS